jgi:hypothetical protein
METRERRKSLSWNKSRLCTDRLHTFVQQAHSGLGRDKNLQFARLKA